MTEKLQCPICECWFLRVAKASKTCSRECSHKLVKRQPRLAKYRKVPTLPDLLVDILGEIKGAPT